MSKLTGTCPATYQIPDNIDFWIGAPNFGGWGGEYSGQIDEVSVWNRALTQEEIQSTICTKPWGNESGLMGYWNFDDETASDLTANRDNGTPFGNPIFVEEELPQLLAPTLEINKGLIVGKGSTGTIGNTRLKASEPNSTANEITFTLLTVPANGSLKKNDALLSVNSSFTQADIDAEKIKYVHNGTETGSDQFTFTVSGKAGCVTITQTSAIGVRLDANRALSFDGSSSVNVKHDDSLNHDGNYTMMSWVYLETAGNYPQVLGKSDWGKEGPTQYQIQFAGSLRKPYGYCGGNGGRGGPVFSNTVLALNKWYHLASVVTYDGTNSTMKIYINGKLDTTGAQPGKTGNATSDLTIGSGLKGKIDEVALFNKALTQEEIQSTICTKLWGNESGLVGYWSFDMAASGFTGNGNNGTLSGNPTFVKEDLPQLLAPTLEINKSLIAGQGVKSTIDNTWLKARALDSSTTNDITFTLLTVPANGSLLWRHWNTKRF